MAMLVLLVTSSFLYFLVYLQETVSNGITAPSSEKSRLLTYIIQLIVLILYIIYICLAASAVNLQLQH